jgi:hypothetical protein
MGAQLLSINLSHTYNHLNNFSVVPGHRSHMQPAPQNASLISASAAAVEISSSEQRMAALPPGALR